MCSLRAEAKLRVLARDWGEDTSDYRRSLVRAWDSLCLQEQLLMHRWRFPSLSLHGIEGAFSESGAKTVIPRKVTGKFSIRLVPDMDPKTVEHQVRHG